MFLIRPGSLGYKKNIFLSSESLCIVPCPSFPCFFEKGKKNHQQNKEFFIPSEPLKPLEKKGKTLKKNKEFLAGEKDKEFKKNKERKDRVNSLQSSKTIRNWPRY